MRIRCRSAGHPSIQRPLAVIPVIRTSLFIFRRIRPITLVCIFGAEALPLTLPNTPSCLICRIRVCGNNTLISLPRVVIIIPAIYYCKCKCPCSSSAKELSELIDPAPDGGSSFKTYLFTLTKCIKIHTNFDTVCLYYLHIQAIQSAYK